MILRAKAELTTLLRGDPREKLLAELLDASPVTNWLERASAAFHLSSIATWNVTGYNTGEWSELTLEPQRVDDRASPISAQCKVRTGWLFPLDSGRRGLALSTELRFGLLELDAERQPGDIRHETTPAPAPTALGLDETMDALLAALRMADTATALFASLTGESAESGDLALWVTTLGHSVDRVIDFTDFRLIPGSSVVSEHFLSVGLPLDDAGGSSTLIDDQGARRVACSLLEELLERSGRREFAEKLDALSNPRA